MQHQVLHFTVERGDDIYAVSKGYRKSYGRFRYLCTVRPEIFPIELAALIDVGHPPEHLEGSFIDGEGAFSVR